MNAAIETVAQRVGRSGGRFVALLGEMRELGDYSDEEHAKVGRALAENGAAMVVAFGALAGPIASAAADGGVEAHHFADLDEAYRRFRSGIRPDDVILVKGSRGIQMERFIDRLQEEAG